MKLVVAQLIAVLASIGLGEAGQRTGELVYIESGILALGLGGVLMLATFVLEIVECLREGSLRQGLAELARG
ncbi:hypothetical protein QO021_30280 (plasmid) [Pseudomonas amygdali pv. lachrymans]|uniref:hypothetical protein n=1 Tax=Pseudomonas amygdali TaxID=47877 RepID=UPI0006B9DB3F|nr:hypothetical protein [Pseudomonas amygdali]RMM39169.1 hypothetical protein ALQ79_200537 [Pseudomonas amygdali pv. lachrymans]WIO61376.1 hypothetical protein QO021_30280 [Pseudomonas amygdali pv. lachrymans]